MPSVHEGMEESQSEISCRKDQRAASGAAPQEEGNRSKLFVTLAGRAGAVHDALRCACCAVLCVQAARATAVPLAPKSGIEKERQCTEQRPHRNRSRRSRLRPSASAHSPPRMLVGPTPATTCVG